MAFAFCSFSSGSSGNCYLVKSDGAALLVDAGISGRRIFESLKQAGTDPSELSAVLVTHEHTDHVRGLGVVSRKIPHLRAYANSGTWNAIVDGAPDGRREVFVTGGEFSIGDIAVKSFALSHDAAEPVGFSLRHGGRQISILTDTGVLDRTAYDEVKDADLLVLEANHDVDMLRIGRYPMFLKRRILGDKGHLSNVDAASAILRILSEKKKSRRVLLAHLSRENNFPEMAYQTVKNLLEEGGCHIGPGLSVSTIARDEMSAVYVV